MRIATLRTFAASRSFGCSAMLALLMCAFRIPAAEAAITSVTISSPNAAATATCPTTVHFNVTVHGAPNEPFIWIAVYSFGGVAGNTGASPVRATVGPSGTTTFGYDQFVTFSAPSSNSFFQINTQTQDMLSNFNSAPLPVNVACETLTVAPPGFVSAPVNLRPAQSVADCTTHGAAASDCERQIELGRLQLIWDESMPAAEFSVMRVDGGHHDLVGTATGEKYYPLLPPPADMPASASPSSRRPGPRPTLPCRRRVRRIVTVPAGRRRRAFSRRRLN